MRIQLQGLFYALRSFFPVVGFVHDMGRLPCAWSHTPRRHPRMSGDHCPFVDSPQRSARMAEGDLPCRHRPRNEEAQQDRDPNRSQPGSRESEAEAIGRLSSVGYVRRSPEEYPAGSIGVGGQGYPPISGHVSRTRGLYARSPPRRLCRMDAPSAFRALGWLHYAAKTAHGEQDGDQNRPKASVVMAEFS